MGKEAAVPMTRESLHPDPTAIDATGGPSALSISNQSALISSAQSKHAPTSAAFSNPKIDITTANDSTRMVVDNISSLFIQEDVPQEVPQRNDDRNEELSRVLEFILIETQNFVLSNVLRH